MCSTWEAYSRDMDAEMMVKIRRIREGDDSLCLKASPKENIILTHYIISAWWLHLMDGLGYYVIHLGEVAQILVINNNIKTLGYKYYKAQAQEAS